MISGPLKYITMLISLPYFVVLYLRHALYDTGIFKSTHFPNVITVAIGNLNVGGSGKTPFTKFLFNSLSQKYNVVILSRGYGRKSKGFFEVTTHGDVEKFGDEALEIKQATGADFFVCESRVEGVAEILKRLPSTQIILLDDALQHRKLRTDIKILLSTFQLPYYKDQLIPFGTLRDIRHAAAYSDLLVITKSPSEILEENILDLHHHVPFQYGEDAFYSQIHYLPIVNPETQEELSFIDNLFLLGVSAIANPKLFQGKLKESHPNVEFYKKLDHSYFTKSDCQNIQSILDNHSSKLTRVVCTEKDYNKLNFAKRKYGCNFDIYILPISVNIGFGKETFFEESLENLIQKEHTS